MTKDFSKSNLKKKPFFLELIPWHGKNTAIAVFPNVYLPSAIYENLISNSSSPYNNALVLHEQEHISRAKSYGVLNWYFRYLINPKFRLNEEIAAINVQMMYLKDRGLEFDLEKSASYLSGWLYGKATSHENALKTLQNIWSEI